MFPDIAADGASSSSYLEFELKHKYIALMPIILRSLKR